MNMAHRVLLCCSQKPGFSTSRQTGISFNPVKLQKTQPQLGLCLVEPYCWALLPAGLNQPWWSWVMRLPFLWFSLSIQSRGHSQGRTRSAWKWKGLWFSVEPKWHHTKHSLVKASWLSCSSYLHSASTCLLYITVPLVKCNYINAVLALTSVWRWIILYRRRLTCVSPAELISVSLISMFTRTSPSPGYSLPTLQQHGRGFRKPAKVSVC